MQGELIVFKTGTISKVSKEEIVKARAENGYFHSNSFPLLKNVFARATVFDILFREMDLVLLVLRLDFIFQLPIVSKLILLSHLLQSFSVFCVHLQLPQSVERRFKTNLL